MWPVEEIGKNSEIPSTTESIKACKRFIIKIIISSKKIAKYPLSNLQLPHERSQERSY